MAAALAVSMMAPSCLPQTLWAAEFSSESAEEASEGFAEKIADNMEENENTADAAVTEPDEIVKDETEDSGPAEDQDFGSDDEKRITNLICLMYQRWSWREKLYRIILFSCTAAENW